MFVVRSKLSEVQAPLEPTNAHATSFLSMRGRSNTRSMISYRVWSVSCDSMVLLGRDSSGSVSSCGRDGARIRFAVSWRFCARSILRDRHQRGDSLCAGQTTSEDERQDKVR